MTIDARPALRSIYRDREGFNVPRAEERLVKHRKSSPLYGELMPTATMRLLEHLRLTKRDTLYDLGSGVGKLILQAAITTEARCVGIELVRSRHLRACDALLEAQAMELITPGRVQLIESDFLSHDLLDATVIYCCSTAFPPRLMRSLCEKLARHPRLTRWVTLQTLDENPHFELGDVLRLDTTWRRRAPVHVYRPVR